MAGAVTALNAITLTPTEITTVDGFAAGGGDATGLFTSAIIAVQEAAGLISALNAKMPAGSNKTALAAVITTYLQ